MLLDNVYKNVPLTSIMAHIKDMSQLMGCCDSNTADCPSTVLRDSNRMSIWTHGAEESYPHCASVKVNTPVENMRWYIIYSIFSSLKMNGYDGSLWSVQLHVVPMYTTTTSTYTLLFHISITLLSVSCTIDLWLNGANVYSHHKLLHTLTTLFFNIP